MIKIDDEKVIHIVLSHFKDNQSFDNQNTGVVGIGS